MDAPAFRNDQASHPHDDAAVERVKAAAQHVRLLMLRDETPDEIEHEVRELVRLVDEETRESTLETAIEVLAMAPPEQLERFAALAADRRDASERSGDS